MHKTTDTRNDWHCYLLQCADNTFYTGITNNLEKRIAAHNHGTASKYTRGRLPVQLVYSEIHDNRSRASQREAQIKRLSRARKIQLIETKFIYPRNSSKPVSTRTGQAG